MKNKNTKICSACKKEKLKTEFHKNKQNKDKLEYRCKECCKIKRRNHYLKNQEKEKEASRLYSMNHKEERIIQRKKYNNSENGKTTIKKYQEEHKEEKKLYNITYRNSENGKRIIKKHLKSEKHRIYMRTYKRNYRKNNPLKEKANRILQKAIKDGVITRPNNCSICNKTNCRIDGHHEDYSKPLVAVWCCGKCHGVLDEERRKRENRLLRNKLKEKV